MTDLTQFFKQPESTVEQVDDKMPCFDRGTIKDRIKHLRLLILVHSYIYYHLSQNIVSDGQWDTWAKELKRLQEAHTADCNIGVYDDAFSGWEGHSGFNLPKDDWVAHTANSAMRANYRFGNPAI